MMTKMTRLFVPPSIGEIESFEAKWKIKLPPSYRQWLASIGGGGPAEDLYPLSNQKEKIARIHFFYGLGEKNKQIQYGYDLDYMRERYSEYISRDLLLIGNSDSGEQIAIDLIGHYIWRITSECFDENFILNPKMMDYIADSFDEFLSLLTSQNFDDEDL